MGCESQIAVDSVEEEVTELDFSILNHDKSVPEAREGLTPGPITDFQRSSESETFLKKRGLDTSQKANNESLKLEWKVGEEAFNSMFDAGIMSCHDGPHPQSLNGTNAILTDCICPPNCGGGGYDPGPGDPGDPIQITADSHITTLSSQNTLLMDSWSAASEPIYFIDVIGSSYRNGGLLIELWDGGFNQSNAATSLSATKQSFNPEYWEQIGEHVFSDEEFNNDPEADGGTLIVWTYDDTSF